MEGFQGKTNGNEEWAVEPSAQLMDHVPFPGVVGLAFFFFFTDHGAAAL